MRLNLQISFADKEVKVKCLKAMKIVGYR